MRAQTTPSLAGYLLAVKLEFHRSREGGLDDESLQKICMLSFSSQRWKTLAGGRGDAESSRFEGRSRQQWRMMVRNGNGHTKKEKHGRREHENTSKG